VSRSTADLVDSALGPAGFFGDEYALYSMLAASTALSPTELARWMAAPPTTVSSYIKRLETRGHIERVPNPEDRRSYRIRLTLRQRGARERHQAFRAAPCPGT
jgi:DNA-binding MarR family transcriptional regulator